MTYQVRKTYHYSGASVHYLYGDLEQAAQRFRESQPTQDYYFALAKVLPDGVVEILYTKTIDETSHAR